MTARHVRLRTWVRASDADRRTGLLGFISVFVADLIVDSITLRRTESGRLALSFPERRDRSGRPHSVVRPVDDDARRAIEAEILGQLGHREDAAAELEADDA